MPPFVVNPPSRGLEISLLGPFVAKLEGQTLPSFAYDKIRALLVYLATESHLDHAREALATLLWPNHDGEAAKRNLRLAAFNLRRALGDGKGEAAFLLAGQKTLRFNPDSSHWLDVREFEAAAPACPAHTASTHCRTCLAQMERMATLYRGPFLEGWTMEDAPDFEEWLLVRRESLHRHALALLERLSDCHERDGNLDQALRYARRCTELEPWGEEGHRKMMRLLAASGQSGAALAQYESCRRMLEQELGVTPEARTQQLLNLIRDGQLAPATQTKPPLAVLPTLATERRQVTVLYCGFSLPGMSDPDELAEKLYPAQRNCVAIVQDLGGHVTQTYGGGILAYFGYPAAHEDAARRAVRAALRLHEELKTSGLQARTAIHTGLVVTSDDPLLPDAIGATSGFAIRLRDVAEPGTIVISHTTRRLVEGYFKLQSLGLHDLKDAPRPAQVYQVGGESGARHRLEASTRRTPLVGRTTEIWRLAGFWEEIRQGACRIVLLRGEPGVGKSRLVDTLRERVAEGCAVRELRCLQEFRHTPFYPLIALLHSVLGFAPEDTPQGKRAKLESHVAASYAGVAEEATPLLAQLLSVPWNEAQPELNLSPQRQKERTLAILLGMLRMLAEREPLLLILEDLHWIDPSTLELLDLFVEGFPKPAVLLLLTARPEFDPPWREGGRIDVLDLAPLSQTETRALVDALAGKDALAPETRQRIVESADGIPLFAEEMTLMFLEAGAHAPSIPWSLHDLLLARLDSVGEAKAAAQFASTIGREFEFSLLSMVSPLDHATLQRALERLEQARLISSRPGSRRAYQFGHALIREAAYQSQSKKARQAAHHRIAQVLQDRFADHLAAQPEILAQHFAAAGDVKSAATAWLTAGQHVMRHCAYAEAVEHCSAGLELVPALPAGAERNQLELNLQLGLGASLYASKGWGSAAAGLAYARALELCGQVDDSPELFQALWGLWVNTIVRFGSPTALASAQKLFSIAQRSNAPVLLVQARYALGNNLFWMGDFRAARASLDHAIGLYTAAYREACLPYGENPAVASEAYLSWSLWFLGYPEEAVKASERSVALAREVDHPYTLGLALAMAGMVSLWLRFDEKTLRLAEEILAQPTLCAFPLWHAMAIMLRGWAQATRKETGIAEVLEGFDGIRKAMGNVGITFLMPLAEIHLRAGQPEKALELASEATERLPMTGERYIEAEVLRVKGESLAALPSRDERGAEACFEHALVISRRQRAKFLELRAAMSMVRLRQGKGDQGWDVLGDVYGWFRVGFPIPDLEDAKTLLGLR